MPSPVSAGHFWDDAWVPWACLGLIMGNHFPCFHGFKGGKGVANFIGFHLVLLPLGTILAAAAYGVTLAIVRIPFLASFALVGVLTGFGVFRWGDALVGLIPVIVTALCGHGHFDLTAYEAYLSGSMQDEDVTDERLAEGLATLP